MKIAKLASTIMLARDHNGKVEVLLLKRNKALAFAGGLWVFPGGKIEPNEIKQSNNELEAAKLAASRETKEEADLNINPHSLIFFRHWTTPIPEPRRYATYFFFGAANNLSTEVTIDDSEIKKHLWINPQEALDKFNVKELRMMPPTLMSLQLIRKCTTVAAAMEIMRQEEPIFVLPVVQPYKGKMYCMYQGDAGYVSGNAATSGARHRLVMDMVKGGFVFEFENCEGVKPVNSNSHL